MTRYVRVRPHDERAGALRRRVGADEHDLADVARLGHEAERGGGLGQCEGLRGERPSSPGVHGCRQIGGDGRPTVGRTCSRIVLGEGHRVVADVGPQRCDLVGAPDVALAELDEAAAGRERRRRLRGMASPASELSTTSTPRPPVAAQTSVGERARARVHDVLDAERRR